MKKKKHQNEIRQKDKQDQQNIAQTNKDWATRTLTKTGVEVKCSTEANLGDSHPSTFCGENLAISNHWSMTWEGLLKPQWKFLDPPLFQEGSWSTSHSRRDINEIKVSRWYIWYGNCHNRRNCNVLTDPYNFVYIHS